MRRVLLLMGLLAVGTALLLQPLDPRGLHSHPAPAPDFEAGLRAVRSLQAEDTGDVAPECGTRFLSHGARTRRVVVMFHGLTNCPAQFDSLGRLCFERGANVLIPRLPHHGLANRMTGALAASDAREMVAFTDRVLDAAAGLGDSVTVIGLSVGAIMAAWAAQERGDVARAVVIAPIFGVARAPGVWTPAVTRFLQAVPNRFVWWDDKRREDLLGPRHVYPRFATRAVAATLVMGAAVMADAHRAAPACRSLAMVTVGGDQAADNTLAAETVRRWRRRGARDITTVEFPPALHLSHDIVDPEQVGGDVARTYPVLLRLLGF